jgi:hypothetical protein
VSDWSYHDAPGAIVQTPHYQIRTTIAAQDVRTSLAQLMEGAIVQYQTLAGDPPTVPLTDRRMVCYLFATRPQWADFTARSTGPDATIYLQINRGGYCIRDWYVAYYIGDVGTYSVASHEGWHQFVARHYKGRLPPVLEEGIACMFENVRWTGTGVPRWNLSVNAGRAQQLRNAIENKKLWPLEELIGMHAGQVVSLPSDRIEPFYAQSWAFARFLREAESGQYRPAMQALLCDTAAGTVVDPTHVHQRSSIPWRPEGVRPMLEHYLGMDLAQIDKAYQAYIRKIAFEEFGAQWQS